jgi:hypothetical protein
MNESKEELKQIAETWEESYNGHAVELKKKRLMDLIESPEMLAAQKAYKEATEQYEKDNEEWWDSLSEEDREKAFYAVCKRIHKADIVKAGSYRYALYQIFGFDMSMYGVGMDAGYMDIHNNISGGITLSRMTDAKQIIIKNRNSSQTIEIDDNQKVFIKLKDDDNLIEIELKELPKTFDDNV